MSITTDHGAIRETVVAGETGWLIKPGDADAWADRIPGDDFLAALAKCNRSNFAGRKPEPITATECGASVFPFGCECQRVTPCIATASA